jgi:hypothetical protein
MFPARPVVFGIREVKGIIARGKPAIAARFDEVRDFIEELAPLWTRGIHRRHRASAGALFFDER